MAFLPSLSTQNPLSRSGLGTFEPTVVTEIAPIGLPLDPMNSMLPTTSPVLRSLGFPENEMEPITSPYLSDFPSFGAPGLT